MDEARRLAPCAGKGKGGGDATRLEVLGGIRVGRLGEPIIVRQVGCLGQEPPLPLEDRIHVVRREAMREVDVARDLLALLVEVPHEDDDAELAVAHVLLARR